MDPSILPGELPVEAFRNNDARREHLPIKLLQQVYNNTRRFGTIVGNEIVFREGEIEAILQAVGDSFDMMVRHIDGADGYFDFALPHGNMIHWDRSIDFKVGLDWVTRFPSTATSLPITGCDEQCPAQ